MKEMKTSRIQLIDTIRGIALLSILLFNIQTYALFAFLKPQQVYDLHLDTPDIYAPLQFLAHIFVNGQFYTIYSFLFGLGFYLLLQKNNRLGLNSTKIFRRRLWALLIIGLLHGFIFWFGDILHKYAILGFSLIYFNKKSISTIFKWIIGLMMLVIVLQTIIAFVNTSGAGNNEIQPIIMEVMNTWQSGTFIEVLNMQKLGVAMLWVMSIKGGLSGWVHFETMFLLGLIAGKSNFFYRISDFRKIMIRWALIIFPVALALKVFANIEILGINISGIFSPPYMELAKSLSIFISVPLLAICYIIILTLLLNRDTSLLTRWIGNAGRLGLTNYLMQTFICMLLFYGYAFGLSGKLTLGETLLCALVIFIFQVIYSNIYLKYYDIGPMEKLWRKFY